jgi:transposase
MSLARLRRQQDAVALLAPVLGWFTEGFDTADLKEAKTLLANTAAALDRLVRKLGGEGVRLRFCYEAGPCGYGIQRYLLAHGHECVVVAPSLIPKRAGDRVKTDRRDADSLARLHRAGELTAVWVPDDGHEAMRDLVRACLDAVHALRRARQQLSGFLLRQGCHYGRPAWTKLRRRKFEQAVHHIIISCSRTTSRRSKPPRPGAID